MGVRRGWMKKQTVIDLLAAGRVANLPSVVSNVVTGAVVLRIATWPAGGIKVAWIAVVVACLAGCLLYLGGCFLNDWWDRDWDRKHKPNRAIPTGRLPKSLLFGFAIGCLGSGLLVGALIGVEVLAVVLVIISLILIYSSIHKKTGWGVLPMGLCRSCLYFLGYVAAIPKEESLISVVRDGPVIYFFMMPLVLPAIGVTVYIAGLSMLARFEAKGDLPVSNRLLALLLLFVPALTHSVWGVVVSSSMNSLVAVLPFLLVVFIATRLIRKSLSKGVSLLLAGIPLLDFVLIWSMSVGLGEAISKGFSFSQIFSGSPFYSLSIFLMSLFAFVLALILQRIAPAT